ncbi:MAG: carboxypeptidase-like regulatory domain-containing protein, partial [Bacteroidetes bacterium]|nr:carboxypeptidase-like regulatory domain-containing protein [Bacteroidota bacterium]
MTIRIFLSTVSMLLIFCSAYAQNEDIKKIKHTISGYVTDSTTGENLIGAYIIIKDLAQGGVTTNEYGFYSISLPTGTYQVTYSYLGYYNKKITVILDKKRRLNMALAPSVLETQEVLINVEAEDQNIQSTEMSKIELPIEQIKTLPALFGEVDILKTIQLLPG